MTGTAAGRTEGPWRLIVEDHRPDEPCIVGAGHTEDFSQYVATCHGGLCDREVAQHVNAAFIVQACNSHDDLVKALERISELSRPGQTVSVPQAVDLLCDVWNLSRAALATAAKPAGAA